MNEIEPSHPKAEEEISLLDLLAVLLRHRVLIILVTLFSAVFIGVVSVVSIMLPPDKSFMPNEYSPKALLLINENSSSGSLSSKLNASGLGSLASLAGIRTATTSYNNLAIYLTGTNSFLDAISDHFQIPAHYEFKKTTKAATRAFLKRKIKTELDKVSGVLSISYTDIDPVFAQAVTNYCVSYLENRFSEMGLDQNKLQKENLEKNIETTYSNILSLQKQSMDLEHSVSGGTMGNGVSSIAVESSRIALELEAQKVVYTQLKTQYELVKITIASESPVFQILESAEVPDRKSGPSRSTLCLIVTFIGFFVSVFLAFILNTVANVKQDSEAMSKFKSGKQK